ncbi:MAG: DUF465 domain-containing protein [Pseudomonadota bacterium]
MAVQSHIDSLKTRHQQLDNQIRELMSSSNLDTGTIGDLKRKKLQIKDRIRQLSENSAD